MKVAILSPVVGGPDKDLSLLSRYHGPDVELVAVSVADGPTEISNEVDSMRAAPHVVELAEKAQGLGADAIVINCMADPGLIPAREAVSLPVIGAGECAINWAYSLGGRIGWIDVADDARQIVQRQFDLCGAGSRYKAFSTIAIPPTQLESSGNEVFEALCDRARMMYTGAGVNTFIPGCTLLTDMKPDLKRWLAENVSSTERFEVIAGFPIAVSTAVTMARHGHRNF